MFTPPPDLLLARSGVPYPLDLWEIGSVGRASARVGQVRYANSLPERMVDRLVVALTRDPGTPSAREAETPDLVVDPFVGGGTTALVSALRGLRFVGGDLNSNALAFTAARVSRAMSQRAGTAARLTPESRRGWAPAR